MNERMSARFLLCLAVLAFPAVSASCALSDALSDEPAGGADVQSGDTPDASGSGGADVSPAQPDVTHARPDVSPGEPDAREAAAGITLGPAELKLFSGDEILLDVAVEGADGQRLRGSEVASRIIWRVDDEAVAGVTRRGEEFELKGLQDGSTRLYAEIDGAQSALVEVEVVRWAQISAGSGFTCGLLTDGQALCWGSNSNGQLGIGEAGEGDWERPTPVAGGLRFKSISAGGTYACGVTTDNKGYCWGARDKGQLGIALPNGDAGVESAPVEVAGERDFERIMAGGGFSCGVTTDKLLFCWGDNERGEVGQDPNGGSESSGARYFDEPKQLTLGDVDPSSLVLGGMHACARRRGAMYCWGSNGLGQLGRSGAGEYDFRPDTFEEEQALRIGGFITSALHTCALDGDAALYCWGANSSRQVKPGSSEVIVGSPVKVSDELKFVWVAGGPSAQSTCALSEEDELYCWGLNNYGNLGFEASADAVRVPTRVETSHSWSELSLALALAHSCGVTRDRSEPGGYCWGHNDKGQLGVGGVSAAEATATPTPLQKPQL